MSYSKKAICAFSVALFYIAASSSVQALPKMNSVSISGDRGGYVIDYALRVIKLKQRHTPVEFRGSCDSACTLYLALPRNQVCVHPQSTFMFHMPYGASGAGNKAAANFLQNSYPGWVRSWIRSNGGLSSRPITLSYAHASKFLKTCGSAAQTVKTRVAANDN